MKFIKHLVEQLPTDTMGGGGPQQTASANDYSQYAMPDGSNQDSLGSPDMQMGGDTGPNNIDTDNYGDPLDAEQAQTNLGVPEDPNRQGLIRRVDGAHLVYKRQTEDGTYGELWIYNVDPNSYQSGMETRKAILAGTDIQQGQTQSDDGKQSYRIWTVGNAEMIKVEGLPN